MKNGRHLAASRYSRAEVGQVLVGVPAAVPVHVVADGHVGERVHVGARVRGRHHVLGHVAETGVVDRAPRLGAGDPDAARGPVVEDLERRVAREQRHAREAGRRQRDRSAPRGRAGRPRTTCSAGSVADRADVRAVVASSTRPPARLGPSSPVLQRAPDALGRQRQVADDDARRVAHGGGDRRRDAQERALAHALRAVRPGAVVVLDASR